MKINKLLQSKVLWLVVTLIAVIAFSSYYLVSNDKFDLSSFSFFGENIESSPQQANEVEMVTHEIPIVIATKFKNKIFNLSDLADKQDFEVFVDEELISFLDTETVSKFLSQQGLDYSATKIQEWKLDTTQLSQLNNYQNEAYVFTTLDKLDPTVKVVPFAMSSEHPLELIRNSKQDYPLVVSISEEELPVNYLTGAEIQRVFFGGEIIPARAVDRLSLNVYNDYTVLFDRFSDQMKSADLTIAMLENPISGDPAPCTGCTVFVGDVKNAEGFAEVGFDILGFGNHAGDGGVNALIQTEKALAEVGIEFTGVSSKNLDDAAKLVVKDLGDKKLGFLAFDDVAWFYFAGEDRWGTNRFSTAESRATVIDKERINSVITSAKNKVDFLVVYPSWGVEYTNKNNAHQREMAEVMIDAGVDMIVGSHPHWVQNFDIYNGTPIFYSLGNFVFDQTHTEPTRQGIVMNTYFIDANAISFEVIPHKICGYHQTGNNLVSKVISGELSYREVDEIAESKGCVYWQPKPLDNTDPVYDEIFDRLFEYTEIDL